MSAAARFTGRAERVQRYLLEHPKGATLRALVIAVEPGCKPTNMAGTVSTLVAQKKLTSKRVDGQTIYQATRTALTDGRSVANAKKTGKPRGPNKKRRAAASPATSKAGAELKRQDTRKASIVEAMQPVPATAPAVAPAADLAMTLPSSLSALFLGADNRRVERDRLAADMAAFEANGGVVQKLAWGESAESIREREAQAQQRLRDSSAIPKHQRAKRAA